jgi:hypothetical protein
VTLSKLSRPVTRSIVVVALVLGASAISVAAQGHVERAFIGLERGVAEYPIDGLTGLLLGLLLGEDTTYASGYSKSGFTAVKLGMSRAEVEALIGVPQKGWSLDEANPLNFGARWSYSPGDTHYRCRVLLFRDGRVAEKHTDFYVD